jgi:hypothetical protein
MLNSVFVICLLLPQGFLVQFLQTVGDLKEKCATRSNNFLTIYKQHFLLVNFLTITVLQTDEYQKEVLHLAEDVLKVLNQLDCAVKIEVRSFANVKPNEASRPFGKSSTQQTGGDCCHAPTREDVMKTKKLTTASSEGFLVLAWSPKVLWDFLDEFGTAVVPKPRTTYALLFGLSSSSNCVSLKNQMHQVLRRFWSDYNILDVIAQAPCSCVSDQIHIYRPFLKIKNSWGGLRFYSTQEIVSDPHLIVNALRNLNQYPVRIAVFENTACAIKVLPKLLQTNPIYKNLSSSSGFAGSDGLLLGALVKYLNIDPVMQTNMPRYNYGHEYPNGSITGVFAMVLNKETDWGLNARIMTYYKGGGFEYTVPYISDKISVVVPKAEKVPRWWALVNCFDNWSWILIHVTISICCIFWYLIRSSSFVKAVSEMCSLLMGVPCRISPSTCEVFFLVSCAFFSLVVLGIVQGSLFKAFTTITFYPDANTLEEVVESGLPVITFAGALIKDNSSSTVGKLIEKSIPFSEDVLDLVAYQKNIVAIHRRRDVEIEAITKYLGQDGVSLLHIVDQSIASFYLSSIVPKDSPFLMVFNRVITAMFESGLTSKWFNDLVYSLFIENLDKVRGKERLNSFSLSDIQSAFYILGVGYVCSIFALLWEMTWYKCQTKLLTQRH